MTRIDDDIRAALSAEEKRLFDELGADMSMHELLAAPFRTRMRWWSAYGFFLTIVFTGIGVWCGYHFVTTPEVYDRVFWGLFMLMAMIAVSMLKLWFFMEMNKVAIVRELRRVELQIAAIARST